MSRQLHVGFCARAITQSYRAHTERPQRRARAPAKDLLRASLSPPGVRARAGRRRAFPSAGSGGQNVRVQVAMLGPLEVRDGAGSAREVSGARLRALLVLLALRAGQVVPAGSLIGELWGERLPADAPNALQALVSRLRRALGDPEGVVSGPAGYRLAAGRDDVDVFRFEWLAGRGRAALSSPRTAEADGLLGQALALWRGEPLPDAAETEAGRAAIARLTELRLAVTKDLIDAELRLSEDEAAAGALGHGRTPGGHRPGGTPGEDRPGGTPGGHRPGGTPVEDRLSGTPGEDRRGGDGEGRGPPRPGGAGRGGGGAPRWPR